jgi:hypothetical protein
MAVRRLPVEHHAGVRHPDMYAMQKADNETIAQARAIASRYWLQLIDSACRDMQVASAGILRTEAVLQMALELGAIDLALLLRWGKQAALRLAEAIPNPLWPESVIDLDDDGAVHIVMLHKRAPVYRSTKD